MAEKNMKARIVHKHDTEANWLKATNFVPMQGEVIVYDIDDIYGYERIKIGDGKTVVSSLPVAGGKTFSVDKSITVSSEGWYRVATSAIGIYNCLGTFRLNGWRAGNHTSAMITAGTNYGRGDSSKISVLHCGVFGDGSITKARIVYHTTYSGNYAYLEFYVVASEDRTTVFNVEMSNEFGWTMIDPTEGSIPDGYIYKEVTLTDTAWSDVEITSAEINQLDGIASNVQTQINDLSTLIGDTSVSEQINAAIIPPVMDNLLDNWYFADPVNSQGLTTYSSGTYAIDRWFMRTAQGNIVDGGFQVNNADGISFYGVTQALNNPTQYCGKTLTFSVNITEINVASAIEIKIASGSSVAGVGTVINELKTITTTGIHSVTATIPSALPNNTLAVWITCRDATAGANYTIESVKLEFGSVSTLAADPVPNKADQIARCSSYDSSGAFLNALFATQAFVLKYVPKITSITLPTANWIFSSNAYYQDVALSCATTTSKVDLQPTYSQLAEWQSDGLAFSTVSQNGAVRVWVTDVKPSEDITIQVTVQEVLEV